jgi:hypothetical protein
MPKPPGPPPDWLALSKTELPPEDAPSAKEEAAAKPLPTDNWCLIRTPAGQSGWALTRQVRMAIPDEVAQYAEGHRIVSYFPLGEVADGDEHKKIWLWTTIGHAGPYDFDSFRVFVWSLRHHRYETAYIERNLEGFAPVSLRDVELSSNVRNRTTTAKFPGFAVCVTGKDGERHQKEFALLGTTVRYAGEGPCAPAPKFEFGKEAAPLPGAAQAAADNSAADQPKESFWQHLKGRMKKLAGR